MNKAIATDIIDFDFQLSASLGNTTVDAAAAGWLLVDLITRIDNRIQCTFSENRIAFGRPHPFCVIEPRTDHIAGRLTAHSSGNGRSGAERAHQFRLASMADMTPALQQRIARAAGTENGSAI